MATLHLICGVPGSGKSTLARRLEGELPALRLTSDEWMSRLGGMGRDDAMRAAVEQAQWEIAARVLKLGVDVILESGFWSRGERAEFRARAAEAGAGTCFYFPTASRDELWRRIQARNADLPPHSFVVDEALLDEALRCFEPPSEEELASRPMSEHRETVRSGYAAMGEAYHRARVAREEANVAWLDGLRLFLPKSGRVVDLGCGSGVPISRYFANRGYAVEGYDLSPEMLDLARREVPGATFHEAAIEEIRLEPGSVDLVVSFFAIIHVEREHHAALFARLFDWLRPGGAALLSLGADDNPLQRSDEWYGTPMAWSHYDAETNLGLLQSAGFEIVRQEIEDFGHERHLFVVARKPESG